MGKKRTGERGVERVEGGLAVVTKHFKITSNLSMGKELGGP
jgi:hypothetical protein